MKKVELKVVDISENGENAKIDYRQQIVQVLKAPANPHAGLDFEEMSTVLPIIDKVQSAVNFVLLEDAEHAEVSKRLKAAKFSMAHAGLFDMIKSVVDAPDYRVAMADGQSQ